MAESLYSAVFTFPLLTLSSLIIITIASYGLYNIYLHPLRKYPGPNLWSAYRLPYVIRAYQGILPFKLLDFHRKYGPVVRIAPDELSFTDPRAFTDLQGRLPDRSQLPKDFHPYGPAIGDTSRQILLANDSMHSRIRRIYAPAFTPKAVEEVSGLLIKYANLLILALKGSLKDGNPSPDMSAFYNYFTFDLTGEFTFDEPFHCLDQGGKEHFYLKVVLRGVIDGFKLMQLERYGVMTLLGPILRRFAMKAKADMNNYTGELIDRRRERGVVPGKADLWNFMLKNESEGLGRTELINNGNVFVVAGSDTTSSLLTGTTYWLCKRPDVLHKVTKEVREAFEKDELITPKAVDDLPYLLAVLNEALRIMPPTAWGWARRVKDPAGQVIAGYRVPQNTYCAISHWAAYHSAANFAHPDDFCPERWLPPSATKTSTKDLDPDHAVLSDFDNDNREALQPFHVGPRGCLGKNLAYAEMRLAMAKMLWHFDMELAEPADRWWEEIKSYSVWRRTPLRVRLKPVVA